MLSIFSFLIRKLSGSKLGVAKEDKQGLSLLHHAAMYNRPQVICRLLMNSVNVNMCRNNFLAVGEYLCSFCFNSQNMILETLYIVFMAVLLLV